MTFYKLNGKRFIKNNRKCIITATIKSEDLSGNEFDAVIYKYEDDNKMFSIPIEKAEEIINSQKFKLSV